MRVMIMFPVEAGNSAIRSGKVGKVFKQIEEEKSSSPKRLTSFRKEVSARVSLLST